MNRIDDIALIARVVVGGDNKAFDRLVKKYQSPMRRFLLHLTCGDEALSDDLAQETFLHAYTHLASFRNLASFSTWLYRIAYNEYYSYLRSRKPTDTLDSCDEHPPVEQPDVCGQIDVYHAIARLSETERTCITLFYIEDQPIDKIAGITNLPTGTIKSHLSRAKNKLSTYLSQNGYNKHQ
jgi:RNA polymerase sigma-70 factor (ECF subfamily)